MWEGEYLDTGKRLHSLTFTVGKWEIVFLVWNTQMVGEGESDREKETERERDGVPWVLTYIQLTVTDMILKKVACGTFINWGSRADIIYLPTV